MTSGDRYDPVDGISSDWSHWSESLLNDLGSQSRLDSETSFSRHEDFVVKSDAHSLCRGMHNIVHLESRRCASTASWLTSQSDWAPVSELGAALAVRLSWSQMNENLSCWILAMSESSLEAADDA